MKDVNHFPTFARWWARLRAVELRRMRRIARHFLIASAAVTVLGMTVLAAAWNYQRCTGIANSMNRMGGCTVQRIDEQLAQGRPVARGDRRFARWCDAMERKYRLTSWQPWLLLLPDPPDPSS
jgi:hypothetical protein